MSARFCCWSSTLTLDSFKPLPFVVVWFVELFTEDFEEAVETGLAAAAVGLLYAVVGWIDAAALGATAAGFVVVTTAGLGLAAAAAGITWLALPSPAAIGTPSRAASASYSLPS